MLSNVTKELDFASLKNRIPSSPAFIVDENAIKTTLDILVSLREDSGCKLLYSMKALPLVPVLRLIKQAVDGFSVSSLFEARLANEILNGQGGIHLTTPGIRPDELEELVSLCSHISCNSLNQYRQISALAYPQVSLGIRINPKLSFSQDIRHDPCRPHSKLGVDTDNLLEEGDIRNIKGLHVHTMYSATVFEPLVHTVDKLRRDLGDSLAKLDWLNLGGGYLFDAIEDKSLFIGLVSQLRNDFDLEVYIEPGNAVVNKAGYLLATVIDCFGSDGKTIAVLDTSVNHHPQVFEYPLQPELLEHDAAGDHACILAGSTCLAGDLFGEYRFKQPLAVGDKVVFKHVGAYSLVKANRFNGYNMPDIYSVSDGRVKRIKQFTYQEYRQFWLGDSLVSEV